MEFANSLNSLYTVSPHLYATTTSTSTDDAVIYSRDLRYSNKDGVPFLCVFGYNLFKPDLIKDVKILDRAVKMEFYDGTVTTGAARDGDEFNPEIGMMICIMEYIFGNRTYNNMFRKWIKTNEKRKKEQEKTEKEKAEAKELRIKKEAERQKAKAEWKEKKKEEQIEIMAEAFRRAMNGQD